MPRILVIGMHRSGTSLVARTLAAAGAWAGRSEDMLAAQSDNPLGFLERRDLVAANEALLAAAGASWFAPPPAPLGEGGDQTAVPDVLAALAAGAPPDAPTLLKDPRLCLTWPAWDRDGTVIVYVYRQPLAVADSLRRRNRFPLAYGLALWEHYNQCALAALRGRPHTCVSYDRIIADPVAALAVLAGRLRALGVALNEPLPAGCCDGAQRRARTADAREAGERQLQSYEQTLLAAHCEALCDGAPLTRPPAPTPSLHARLTDSAAALAPLAAVVETGNALREAEERAAERTGERDRLLERLHAAEADHAGLADAHERERAAHRRLAGIHGQLKREHEALAAAHRAQVRDYKALAARHGELAAARDRLLSEQAALQQETAALQRENAALQQKADYLFHTLSQAYANLLAYEVSTLGRLQRQLTRLYKLLTGRRGTATAYDAVLIAARGHAETFPPAEIAPRPGRAALAADVLRYLARNPAGSLRSLSWPRFRRALAVFLRSSPGDLQVWVNARFPQRGARPLALSPGALDPALDRARFAFPVCEAPRLSIVVPVYNDYRVTVHCLRALHDHLGDAPVEVIVADDGSDDLTVSLEERIGGVRVVRGENLGFLRNCARAVGVARGELLLFLNNDTAVTEGWLPPLLALFDDASVGVAGPMLLFADGALQEAGGIVWRDGSAWNFGRADDAEAAAYNYRKDVDYVSGACLMIRRELWERIGGFDDRFAPAYYEDADLCFAARAAGYRVCYQPASRVFHFEGVSNGTDLGAGVKRHQLRNQAVFEAKWRDELQARHFANAEHLIWARDRSSTRRCVLFIDHYVPHFDRDAGSRSTFLYVQLLLAMGYRVQFMGANFFPHEPYTTTLQQLGVEVLVGEPIARHLDAWLAEHAPYIDDIFLHRPHVAEQFLPHLARLPRRPTVSYFGHDLHYLRIQREAALHADDDLGRSAERWREREFAVFAQVDRIYYFSDVEVAEVASRQPELPLRTLPLYALAERPLPPYAPAAPRQLLFVGGFNHPPNVDAARWLVMDVLPLVNAECSDAHLHLVGSNPSEQVLALASPQVTVHGYLSDAALEALYRRVGVAVVPLRYGAGVKGKVIEAIQHNVPLVTTPVGAEGIPDAAQVAWVADSAPALAEAISAIVLGHTGVGDKLSRYGGWLRRHFSRERAEAVLRRDLPPPERSRTP